MAATDIVVDRIDLASGNTSWGARRGTIVVATPGPLRYQDPTAEGGVRVDYATPEVLKDPKHLDSLRGVRITLEHPDRKRVDINDRDDGKVGTVLDARWEEDAKLPDGTRGPALVVDYVIDSPEGLAAMARGVIGASEGYTRRLIPIAPSDRDRYGGAHNLQADREANHLALTVSPRAAKAGVVDSEEPSMADMDEEAVVKIVSDALDERMKPVMDAIEGVKATLDAMKPEPANDSEPDVDALILDAVKADRKVTARATKLGVKIGDEDTTDSIAEKVAKRIEELAEVAHDAKKFAAVVPGLAAVTDSGDDSSRYARK